MQPTPSPRSTNDAPAFFFTTPFDFFAIVTDHTPAGTSSGRYRPTSVDAGDTCVARAPWPASLYPRSKYFRPDATPGASTYQLWFPLASSFSTLSATGLFSFFIRSTLAFTPTASHSSNGPSSQLKPSRIA